LLAGDWESAASQNLSGGAEQAGTSRVATVRGDVAVWRGGVGNIRTILYPKTVEEVQLAKSNDGQAVLWITDEMGRRLFPVARNAAKEVEDDIELPSMAAMAGVLTTMRSQPTANVLTTMRAQSTAGVLTTMRAQATRH
jgi:hypothetical protein